MTGTVGDYNVDEILADPARTRRVVQAAVDALQRADTRIGPGEFLKPGSEDYAAVSILRHGLIDFEKLTAMLGTVAAGSGSPCKDCGEPVENIAGLRPGLCSLCNDIAMEEEMDG